MLEETKSGRHFSTVFITCGISIEEGGRVPWAPLGYAYDHEAAGITTYQPWIMSARQSTDFFAADPEPDSQIKKEELNACLDKKRKCRRKEAST